MWPISKVQEVGLSERIKYQAECHLPGTFKAEIWAAFETFDSCFQWLDERLRENPDRIGRLITHEIITADQMERITRLEVELDEVVSADDQGWRPIKDAPRDGTVIEIKSQQPPATYRYDGVQWVMALAGPQTGVYPMRSGRPLADQDNLMWRLPTK